jgi:cytoskeletal protein RodZ
MLIALAATMVLAVAWMGFLRPSAVETTTDEVTAPAKIADKAANAAAATEKATAATEAAAKAVEGKTTPSETAPAQKSDAKATAKPKAAAPATGGATAPASTAEGQAAVLREMEAGKVVVLLFWDKTGADDRAARDAVTDLSRRDGKVAVHVVDVDEVGKYGSVTQGVNVTQSPATLIISPTGTARAINGLTERTEVDQLVRDALTAK